MTRPSDVPQDAWDVAEICFPGNAWNPIAIERTARAILAEREVCAQVAETATRITYMHWDPEGLEPVETKIDYREKIANAIRNRSEA